MSEDVIQIDLVMYEGTTFEKIFIWETGDPSEPVDLTGYKGECHVREKLSDVEPVFILEQEEGIIILNQSVAKGGYKFYIPDSISQGKCPNHKDRRMRYDLRLISPDNSVRLHQYGKFLLKAAVTRPWEIQ